MFELGAPGDRGEIKIYDESKGPDGRRNVPKVPAAPHLVERERLEAQMMMRRRRGAGGQRF
jgi:hypothetical protein